MEVTGPVRTYQGFSSIIMVKEQGATECTACKTLKIITEQTNKQTYENYGNMDF